MAAKKDEIPTVPRFRGGDEKHAEPTPHADQDDGFIIASLATQLIAHGHEVTRERADRAIGYARILLRAARGEPEPEPEAVSDLDMGSALR